MRQDPAQPDDLDAAIGARLTEARRRYGFLQGELGKVLGVSQQQIQKYEKGVNRISASKLVRLAEALNCQPSEFLPLVQGNGGPLVLHQVAGEQELFDGYVAMHEEGRRAVLELVRSLQLEA